MDNGAALAGGGSALVMLESGGSRCSRGMVMVCNASMVAEGGVFSPRIAFWKDLVTGLSAGESLKMSRFGGVGVVFREGLLSSTLER